MAQTFRDTVENLYTGASTASIWFRYGLILFDAITILFFIITMPLPPTTPIVVTNMIVAVLILMDFSARLWIAEDRGVMLKRIYTIADLIVVFALFLDPLLPHSLAFLRILRGLRLIHSYQLLGDLRRDSRFFREHEDAVIALINLLVFLFVTSSAVYAFFFDDRTGWSTYIDAMYFTVATLTTTGYGDITLPETTGKIFSIFVMVVGVTLFVQLARTLVQPNKVRHTCGECGLTRHDLDAVHCKHCGVLLKIETEGLD